MTSRGGGICDPTQADGEMKLLIHNWGKEGEPCNRKLVNLKKAAYKGCWSHALERGLRDLPVKH